MMKLIGLISRWRYTDRKSACCHR